jgi:O-antigen/teichoic acid export membrane protein
MNHHRNIVKNSFILFVKYILNFLIGVFTIRVSLSVLGSPAYGLYAVLSGAVAIAAVFSSMLSVVTHRFITIEIGRGGDISEVFRTSVVLHAGLAIITAALAESAGKYYLINHLRIDGGETSDALFAFRMLMISTLVSIFASPYNAILIAKERFVFSSIVAVAQSSLSLIGVFFIGFYNASTLRVYSFLLMIISTLATLSVAYYVRRRFRSLVRFQLPIDGSIFGSMLKFGRWSSIGTVASSAELYVSPLVLNSFYGTVLNAAYGLASQINGFIKMFSQSITNAAIPQITKSYGSGDAGRTVRFVLVSSRYAFFILVLVSFPVVMETDFILNFWLVDVPEYTATFTRIMILTTWLSVMGAGVSAAVQATGNVRNFMLITSGVALLPIPFGVLVLLGNYPPYFFQWGFVVSTLVNLFLSRKFLNLASDGDVGADFYENLVRMVAVVAPLAVLFFNREIFEYGLQRFLLSTGLSIVLTIVLVFCLGMSRIERQTLVGWFFNSRA